MCTARLSALRTHPLGVDCVRKMASGSILHVVCVCINRIGTVHGMYGRGFAPVGSLYLDCVPATADVYQPLFPGVIVQAG